jgi:hypothetical protein
MNMLKAPKRVAPAPRTLSLRDAGGDESNPRANGTTDRLHADPHAVPVPAAAGLNDTGSRSCQC